MQYIHRLVHQDTVLLNHTSYCSVSCGGELCLSGNLVGRRDGENNDTLNLLHVDIMENALTIMVGVYVVVAFSSVEKANDNISCGDLVEKL